MGDTRELRKVFFDEIPVKTLDDISWYKKIVIQIIAHKSKQQSTTALEEEIDEKLFDLYKLTVGEREVVKAFANQ